MNNNKLLLDGIKHYLDNNKPSAVGGGIKLFNFEKIGETTTTVEYIIHDATLNDLKTVFYLDGIFSGEDEPLTVLYAYAKLWDGECVGPITHDFYASPMFFDGEYLDGVKVYERKME